MDARLLLLFFQLKVGKIATSILFTFKLNYSVFAKRQHSLTTLQKYC